MNRKGIELLLVLSLSLVACLPLLVGDGPINTRGGGDSPFLLVRLHQLVANLRAGVFPPRWMPDAAYGLGYPFFNFYASLPYYIAALFKLCGFGFIWAIKLTQILGFVAAATSMYLLAKRLFHREAGAILAALAYTYAPYHLVNVYVRGDALSEFYAFVFYPLILWALLRLRNSLSTCNIALLALSYSGLILTHNISALIFTPFVILYTIFLCSPKVSDRGEISNTRHPITSFLLPGLAGIALALALSAWFWLPALLEGKYVQLEHQTTGYLNYANHFRGLNLVQPSLLFDYAIVPGRTPFAMGLAQAVLTLLGVVAIVVWWIRRRRPEAHSTFFVSGLAISTFLILPLSRPLWDNIPLLPFVQFPWRFLSVQAFFASLVIPFRISDFGLRCRSRGSLVPRPSGQEVEYPEHLRQRTKVRREQQSGTGLQITVLLASFVGAALLATSMLSLKPEYLPIGEEDITLERLMLYEYFTANVGTTIRHEYLPRWVVPRPYTSEVLLRKGEKPPPLVMSGEVRTAELLWRKPAAEAWVLDVTSPKASLAFHTYYFPGWRAYVDGQPREVQPVENLGYIGLDLGQGEHRVILRLERTPLRALAEGVSLVAVLVIVALIVGRKATRQRGNKATRQQGNKATRHFPLIHLLPFVMVILLLGIIGFQTSDVGRRTWDVGRSDLTMDFDRLPYLHHNPQGVNFGGVARLRNYELSAEEVEAGDTLEVVLHWDEVTSEGLEALARLTTPAEYLFQTDATLAEDIVAIPPRQGEATHHHIKVPDDAVRGLYLISVGVRNEEGRIRPINERGETLGTTYLHPVRVRSQRWATGNEPTLANFGPDIVLSEMETKQKKPEELKARLTWRARQPVAANYGLSLRLQDGDGQVLASLDTQPHYGLYPTSMWREGELIDDSYILPLPEGTPPGEDYSLEVVLYEVASLAPIGTARMPVALTQPTIKTAYPVLQQFGQLALVKLGPVTPQIEQGQPLVVEARWAAVQHPTRDYACRVSLRDESGIIVQSQTQPIAKGYATSLWPINAFVAVRYRLPLDPLLPAGRYDLVVAVFDPQTGEGFGEFALPLGVEIAGRERVYDIPAMQVELNISFGNQMRLLGYDLSREEGKLRLRLHWQALRQMEQDYKVFVHLFNPATEVIVAQNDAMPRQNQYPTSWWAEGEIVSDEIALSLEDVPPGRYRLGLGVYDPQTMDRLAAIGPDGTPIANNRVVLQKEVEVP